jgi:prolipoprotein diacylglyceryltransferase
MDCERPVAGQHIWQRKTRTEDMTIDGQTTFPYFTIFYVVAFLTCFVILLVEGRMRNFPVLPWLLVIASGFIFFIVGCRIFAYSIEDWKTILTYQPPDHPTGLVMLGGLLLAVPAILIAKRFVRLNASSLDAYAFVLPVGMFIQRLGCLIAGCCYGTVSSGFGVRYGHQTPAFYEHSHQAILPVDAIHSLPVHAVQLYESIGCLIAVAVLLWIKKRLKSAGSLFYASGLCYYVVRFLTEFFRSPNAHSIDVKPWFVLNGIQWVMLCLIAGSIILLVVRERKPQTISNNSNLGVEIPLVLYFLLLAVISFFASKLLGPAEIVVACLVLFTTGGYLLMDLFKVLTIPKLRLTTACLLFGSLIMMSQTYPEFAEKDSTKISYNTISIGGLWGTQRLDYGSYNACSSKTIPAKTNFQNDYQIGGLGFSRTIQKKGAISLTWGVSAFQGKFKEDVHYTSNYPGTSRIEYSDSRTKHMYAINPYAQFDSRYAGVGIGFHAGDLLTQNGSPDTQPARLQTSVEDRYFYPQAYLRVGRMDRVFGEFSFARNFPSSFPDLAFQASLGVSLKYNALNRGVFRLGTSTTTALFISSAFPVGKYFTLEPYFGTLAPLLGADDPLDQQYNHDKATVGSIALHYKFGKKPIKD